MANTLEAIHALGLKKLKGYIKTIGLFNSKAENIIKTCRILIDQYQSEFPTRVRRLSRSRESEEDVASRPQYGIPADCHGGRHTYFQSVEPHRDRSGKTVLEVEKRLVRLVPEEFLLDITGLSCTADIPVSRKPAAAPASSKICVSLSKKPILKR